MPAASANRLAFLLEPLADLRASLRHRGADLYVRHGDSVGEAMRVMARVGASALFVTEDVSRAARGRLQGLEQACRRQRCRFDVFPGTTVVPAGEVVPVGKTPLRGLHALLEALERNTASRRGARAEDRTRPAGPGGGPHPGGIQPGVTRAVDVPAPRGEAAGRALVGRFVRGRLAGYAGAHDDLGADGASRLSPYLHFGCISPLELAQRAGASEAFVRQLCWRDFHHQVLAAFSRAPVPRLPGARATVASRWAALDAWCQGRTGVSIVDAGMRQLLAEGMMHNRARMLTASFLVKELGLDWRLGARHFRDWLIDADVANDSGNWQWIAGTGNDTRPNRRFNLVRQARRHDPGGTFVRRYVPELGGIAGSAVHEPWRLSEARRAEVRYPDPFVGVPGRRR